MRHSVVPAVFLAAGLLLGPAVSAQAVPCGGKIACAPTEGADDPLPTQPGLAPELDQKPAPKPQPTRVRETQAVPEPVAPAPPVQQPQQPVVTQAPVKVAPPPASPASNEAEPTPTPDATVASATPSSTPSASPSAASSPSKSSNWNTPVDKGRETQAALLPSGSFSGPNMLGLFGILGAVLLVGLGGLAFALWSKNRLSSH